MSLCKACISGVTHEGTPVGKIEEINGVKTYVSLPPAGTEYDKTKAVLFLCDVFGIELINNKLLADDFAKNGYAVYAPDYFNGDAIREMNADFDIGKWFVNHTPAHTRPALDKLISYLKEQGVTAFGATGYCFGARYVFDLAFDKEIKAAVTAHPSLLQAPEDLEKFKATGLPLLINSCETDTQYPPEKQKIGDDILGGGKMEAENYKRAYFPGCTHGFAVRGDMSVPEIKKGKEEAFENSVKWFQKYL